MNSMGSIGRIRYALNGLSDVRVVVYSLNGQLVRTLVNAKQPAGTYSVIWNGRDGMNNVMPNSIYFCRTIINGRVYCGKIMLIK